MAVRPNSITTQQFVDIHVKEIDMAMMFGRNYNAISDIMTIAYPIKKQLGTQLVSYTSSVDLQSGYVPEGEIIPLSMASVKPVYYENLTIQKYASGVTLEAVADYGADTAVQKTDDAIINEIQNNILGDYYNHFILSASNLTANYDTFQMAVAMAIGMVVDKFKKMRRNYSRIVVFANTLDVYGYLGAAGVNLATQNGIQYLKNFLGAETLIVTSELPQGYVYAVPADNIISYYLDPADPEIRRSLDLEYTTGAGVTNLIGVHKEGNYHRAMGDTFIVYGLKLWSQFVDAISMVKIGDAPTLKSITVSSSASGVTVVGDTKITITGAEDGDKYVYKLGADAENVFYYQTLRDGWNEIASGDIITAATGTKITVAKVDENGHALASGNASVTAKTAG